MTNATNNPLPPPLLFPRQQPQTAGRQRATSPLAATNRLEALADDLIATRCFDIPGIVVLLHERVNLERRLQAVIARQRIPPLAKPNFTAGTNRKETS